jgi:hypothetical protein
MHVGLHCINPCVAAMAFMSTAAEDADAHRFADMNCYMFGNNALSLVVLSCMSVCSHEGFPTGHALTVQSKLSHLVGL